MHDLTLVVPCFNEARRLRREAFAALHAATGARLSFVDDGSTDDTAARLAELCAELGPGAATLLSLPRNVGKAEAIRAGLRAALAEGAEVVGFVDADMATPASEVARLVSTLRSTGAHVVMGSRVRLLGSDIDRRPARHYLGRVFATLASLSLGLPVYDTQCGAKVFRDVPALRAALERPFDARWAFDVELLARLVAPLDGRDALSAKDVVEVPLRSWRDVAGSKLGRLDSARAVADVVRVGLRLRRARGATRPPQT